MQHTLRTSTKFQGIGLHSGSRVHVRLCPAPVNTGIVFVRTDLHGQESRIPALWDRVIDTRLCTVIGHEDGARVGTIEHVMAALHGCGVDNLVIELDAPEVPIMDGSAAPFIEIIQECGLLMQNAPRRIIRVLEDVCVQEGDKSASLTPSDVARFGGMIDFDHPAIGRQSRAMDMINGNFCHDLADSRTFGFLHEVQWMQANGLARGGSLDNAIVLDPAKVLNPEGLRHQDEFIRHKLLDAVGDLYLAGAPILGEYTGFRAGHAMNNQLLRALFARPQAWEVAEESEDSAPFGCVLPHESDLLPLCAE